MADCVFERTDPSNTIKVWPKTHGLRGLGGIVIMVKCDLIGGARRHSGPLAAVLAALAVVVVPPSAAAQSDRQRPPAFTEAQAQRGQAIYQKNCQDCHGSTLDNGEFGYVNTLMPPDRPGHLSEQSYVDLTAFLLSSNGYAAGREELTADQDAQSKMTMKR
jgi:hypothetical protein